MSQMENKVLTYLDNKISLDVMDITVNIPIKLQEELEELYKKKLTESDPNSKKEIRNLVYRIMKESGEHIIQTLYRMDDAIGKYKKDADSKIQAK